MESHPSLLAVVHDALAVPQIPDEPCTPHPFSTSYSTTQTRLNTILSTTTQLNHALSQLSTIPSSEQTSKLVSLMKQHTAMSTSTALSRAAATSLSAERHVVVFPDTAPPSPTRLEEWGRAVGMEAFIDSSAKSAPTTVMMAGKVLVLDVDIDGGVVVKTSFAVGNNNTNGPPVAPDLDALLARDIARWVDVAKRASLVATHRTQVPEDPAIEAACLGLIIQDHLRYLMMLDALAVAEGERGIRWFMEPVTAAQHFLDAERPTRHQPLDKMLVRNSLPLLYLDSPSLSFLVWLSPLSYLRLLRSLPPTHPKAANPNPFIDISVAHLTSALSWKYNGATMARLKLISSSGGAGSSPQSSFPNDHTFPQVPGHSWVLEFNRPSRLKYQPTNCGVVVSQSRLRAIHAILALDISTDVLMNMGVSAGSSAGATLGGLGPFGPIGSVTGMNVGNLTFSGFMIGPSHSQAIDSGSWVDLLLNNGSPAEYYKATHNSPSQAHPPLDLRLAAPQEPGFLLQEVPVKTASEVSHILDIVREQCWLNELLGMLQWQADNTVLAQKDPVSVLPGPGPEMEESVSLELLASVVAGTVTPRSIPVSVYLPSTILPPIIGANTSHFALEGLSVGPPPLSGGSSSSLFGSTDIEMDMEIPGLSMSMNSGMDISMAGMDMELSNSPVPSRPSPMIVFSSPTRTADMVELRVSFGEFNGKGGSNTTDCGVRVEASPGIDTRGMDEVVRRGGIWGLPGKVWVNMGPR